MTSARTIGVLALQGGFKAHGRVLKALGATVREVRDAAGLDGLDGLVLPGGESTTMMLGIERERLGEPIGELVRGGLPVLATCAGTIVLDENHLGLLDVACERNAYGGQTRSFEADLEFAGLAGDGVFRGVFIRAPRIVRAGDAVETVADFDGSPVAVRAGGVLALTFHPELAGDDRIHRVFLESVPESKAHVTEIDPQRKAA